MILRNYTLTEPGLTTREYLLFTAILPAAHSDVPDPNIAVVGI